jgi:hypothetical protein
MVCGYDGNRVADEHPSRDLKTDKPAAAFFTNEFLP